MVRVLYILGSIDATFQEELDKLLPLPISINFNSPPLLFCSFTAYQLQTVY